MTTSSTLVIYYSRSGTTAKLAEAIARPLGADTERITDTVDQGGFFGFMRSLRDEFVKQLPLPRAHAAGLSEPNTMSPITK